MKQNLSVAVIDLAKNISHLVGMDERGKIILRKRLMRGDVLAFMAKLPRVTIGVVLCVAPTPRTLTAAGPPPRQAGAAHLSVW